MRRKSKPTMNIFGLIGAVALFPKYKQAKAEYEELKEHVETVRAAVQTYNYHKLDEYLEATTPDEKPNERPAGLCINTLLRVGNLVGKAMRAQTTVIISNTSKTPFYVSKIMVEPKLWDDYVRMFDGVFTGAKEVKPEVEVNRIIEPSETVEINVAKGISALPDMGKLRDLFCAAAGKKLITSCPKINIEDGTEKADIRMWWRGVKDNKPVGETKQMYVLGLPGIVRYCLEAFYP